jgi:hypothetical protein
VYTPGSEHDQDDLVAGKDVVMWGDDFIDVDDLGGGVGRQVGGSGVVRVGGGVN